MTEIYIWFSFCLCWSSEEVATPGRFTRDKDLVALLDGVGLIMTAVVNLFMSDWRVPKEC